MLARLALSVTACLTLATLASADRFFVGTPESNAKMKPGGNYIEGVLLHAVNGTYVIRVEGGQVSLPKSMVYKIEKDGLTVAQIEEREKAKAADLALANLRRIEIQAVDASARRQAREERRAAKPVERELRVVVDFQGLLSNYVFKAYDPVLHRANFDGLADVVQTFLREQVERAAHRRR